MEHGLLVARIPESPVPHLLVAKIDEEVVFDTRTYYLGTNEYRDGTLNPSGFVHLETFRLDEGFPVFTYRLGGIDGVMLEKRIWMQQGRDTTYISYRLVRTTTEEASGYRRSGITGALSNTTTRTHDEPQSLTLTLLPFTAYRPYNRPQRGSNEWHFYVTQYHQEGQVRLSKDEDEWESEGYTPPLPPGVAGCTIRAWDGASPYSLLAVGHPKSNITFLQTNLWYWNFQHRRDTERGPLALDDLYLPCVIRATLWSDEDMSLTVVASTEQPTSDIVEMEQLARSYKRSVEEQRQVFVSASPAQRYFGDGGEAAHTYSSSHRDYSSQDEHYQRYLSQGIERFLVRRQLPHEYPHMSGDHHTLFEPPDHTFTVLSGYYSLQRRTRDTLIALPALLLARRHTHEVARLLREIAHHFKQGLLPDTLPLPGQVADENEYRSIDLLMWYCYALDAYLHTSKDETLLDEVYHTLADAFTCYVRGTLHGIRVDAADGLLTSTDALTWMNAMHNGIPVTPRYGKAVEVNALWYHALSLMSEWSQRLYHAGRLNYHNTPVVSYRELLTRCHESFNRRFWHEVANNDSRDGEIYGYLYDVVDGPQGNDDALRPNQLFAFSLRHPILQEERRTAVLDMVTRFLLTRHGLRTLTPQHEQYRGHLDARDENQAQAMHQGSIWTWLLGPYVDAVLHTNYVNSAPALQHKQTVSFEQNTGRTSTNERYHEYLVRRCVQLLNMQQETLDKGMLGMCESLFDGDAPHTPGHVDVMLSSVSELLRAYHILQTGLVPSKTAHEVGVF
jgi:glycogen debranching enzyme